nr:hypothetical protein SHINE37_42415 [Rhizobiaceae bacterium]
MYSPCQAPFRCGRRIGMRGKSFRQVVFFSKGILHKLKKSHFLLNSFEAVEFSRELLATNNRQLFDQGILGKILSIWLGNSLLAVVFP